MAVVQGLIGIHENHSGQNDSYNGSDCARIVQIFLAPKWHHYLLQNLYQPGPNNCRRHYVTRYCSTSHINPPPPSATAAETMSASEASDHDDLTQYAPGHMPMPDFEALARDIQNRVSRRVGAAMTETRHFREFFAMSVLIIERVWELLDRDSLLPEGGRPKHLLWALHFMKVYPKQSPGCSAVGASAGAVSQKTHRKPQVGLGVYRCRRQPGHRCGKYVQCEDRCGNDIVLKFLGHSIVWCSR